MKRTPSRTACQWLLALLLVVSSAGIGGLSADGADLSPVIPALRASVAEQTGAVSHYALDATLDPEIGTISGAMRVDFVNDTDRLLETIAFRLYPNAYYYGEGETDVSGVAVDGAKAPTTLLSDGTALEIALPAPLAAGEGAAVELAFSVTVPVDSTGSYGIFNRDSATGMWVLSDWYPILAGWDPAVGWRTDLPTDAGDPTYSDVATYDLSLSMPDELTLIATGDESRTVVAGGADRWRITTGPARELTMIVDDDLTETRATADATTVRGWLNAGSTEGEGMAIALASASRALEEYSSRYGAYPYTELDLVETPMPGALGVSWTGLIFLNGTAMLSTESGMDEGRIDFTVAHEVGHQWWGAIVGADSNDHAFMVEGLTNYLALACVEATRGREAADQQLEAQIVRPYLRSLETVGDGVADAPVGAGNGHAPTGALLYGKSALGFLAIHQAVGDDDFFAAIRAYAETFAYRNATPADLLAAFETASDQDLDALWSFWFEEANTTAADVEALLAK